MAKIIKLTPECLDELRREFEVALRNVKLSDGKLNYTKSFSTIKREATVYFTHMAWEKMQALIKGFDKEVAWHGVAHRGENDDYIITDILVYPQEVASATVNTDQEKYQMWLMSQEDDVFNNIRMQGHSHVNMGVTPSSVDTSLYDRILEQLEDDMFYIFLIYNKKGDKTFKIYDLAKNVLFETSDVTVKVLDDTENRYEFEIDGLTEDENKALAEFLIIYRTKKETDKFVDAAKLMVKEKQYSGGSGSGYYGSGYYGGGYGGGGYGGNYWGGGGGYSSPASHAGSTTPPSSTVPVTTPAKKDDEKKTGGSVVYLPSSASKKTGKRKGHRKGKKCGGKRGVIETSLSNAFDLDDDNFGCDYDDGPYSPFGYSRDGLPQ